MAKSTPDRARPENRPAQSAAQPVAPRPWSGLARGLASVAILWQLSAVIIAAVVAAPPFSELAADVAWFFRPYVNAADLNHGYRFFAPEPGPSHLVAYHLEFADGSTRDGKFPDLETERPRLLYHRYFMLSEHLAGLFGEWQDALKNSAGPLSPAERQLMAGNVRDAKRVFDGFVKSYADELLRRTGAKRVVLALEQHEIPSPDAVRARNAAGRSAALQQTDDRRLHGRRARRGIAVKMLTDYLSELYRSGLAGWNRFWFAPADPATLGLIRILAGSMLFYTHLIWSLDLKAFFGPRGWLSPAAMGQLPGRIGAWSYFDWIHSPAGLWAAHLAALAVFLLLTVGLFSRVMAALAFLITVSYANRVAPMALFGLDDINALLAMYLMVGPCGAAYSLDRLRRGAGQGGAPVRPSTSANLAIRLIQVHMCIVYFFSATGKLMGGSWWGGQAVWLSIGNLEYQSLDLTWLADHPLVINALTHLTVLWELSYAVLVWPRLTRPLVIAMAVCVHLGIAVALGMPTFGLVMLIGNAAFLSPALVRKLLDRRAGQGRGGEAVETGPATAGAN